MSSSSYTHLMPPTMMSTKSTPSDEIANSKAALRQKAHELLSPDERETLKHILRIFRQNQNMPALCSSLAKIIDNQNKLDLIPYLHQLLPKQRRDNFLFLCESNIPVYGMIMRQQRAINQIVRSTAGLTSVKGGVGSGRDMASIANRLLQSQRLPRKLLDLHSCQGEGGMLEGRTVSMMNMRTVLQDDGDKDNQKTNAQATFTSVAGIYLQTNCQLPYKSKTSINQEGSLPRQASEDVLTISIPTPQMKKILLQHGVVNIGSTSRNNSHSHITDNTCSTSSNSSPSSKLNHK